MGSYGCGGFLCELEPIRPGGSRNAGNIGQLQRIFIGLDVKGLLWRHTYLREGMYLVAALLDAGQTHQRGAQWQAISGLHHRRLDGAHPGPVQGRAEGCAAAPGGRIGVPGHGRVTYSNSGFS